MVSCSDVLIFCKYRAVLALLHAHFTDFKQNFHVMLHVGKNLMQVGSKLGKWKVKSVLERKMHPGKSLQVSQLLRWMIIKMTSPLWGIKMVVLKVQGKRVETRSGRQEQKPLFFFKINYELRCCVWIGVNHT